MGLLSWLGNLLSEPEQVQNRGARWANLDELKSKGLLAEKGIPLGYTVEESKERKSYPLIRYAGENHLITIGKPGSGKGSTVIIPTLLEYEGSCIIIDPKGQNAAITVRQRHQMGHRVFILNPYNVLHEYLEGKGEYVVNGARFNPLDRIDPLSANFVADVRSLAQALIVDQGGDSHWPDSARELVAAFIMHVCITCTGNKRNLGHARILLTQPLEDFIKTIAEMMRSDCVPVAQKAAQFSAGTNEIKSIISTARTQLAFLDDPKICDCLSQSDFQFSDLKRQKISVYLVLPFRQMEAQGRWLRLLVTSAIEALTDDPKTGDGRILFMLDEFAQLGRLTSIERALALVRGYGVQLWPFVQDLPQLKSVYPDRWSSFLATAGIQQFFTPNDDMTAEYISKRCGTHLVRRKSFSEGTSTNSASSSSSSSTSYSDQWEPLFHPWELYGHENWRQMIFVEGLSPAVWEYRANYFEMNRYAGKADPDPFHIG